MVSVYLMIVNMVMICQPNQLRLSLLRSPKWPDSQCDRGYHEFTYYLYPHKNSWQKAQTVRRGYEVNYPLLVHSIDDQNNRLCILANTGELLGLENENLVLIAFKQGEN